MVNTFLVDRDFRRSAQSLDRARLGKQRVEAMQILHLCQDFRFLSEELEMPIPEDPREYRIWIKTLVQAYQNHSHRYLIRRAEFFDPDQLPADCEVINGRIWATVEKDFFEQRQKKTQPYQIQGQWIYPSDRWMTLGYCYHPAVRMWLGYEEALMDYINAHIDEWIDRGYQNTMEKYEVSSYSVPAWVDDPEFHHNHRAALHKKDPTYYHVFAADAPFVDYIWPN